MGLISRTFERRGQLANPPGWLERMFGWGAATQAGIDVSPRTAMSWAPIAAGIRIIAETLATIPLNVYEFLQPRGRDLRRDHWLFDLLHDRPNPEMTSAEFREVMQTHIPLFGNAYGKIDWRGDGHAEMIWPLNPDRVRMERDKNQNIVYRVSLPADERGGVVGSVLVPPGDMLHIRGYAGNVGFLTESLIRQHREAIGLGLVSELFGAQFFGQGINPAGLIQMPNRISEEAAKRLRTQFDEVHSGFGKAHRALILEEGMQWTTLTMEPQKAQFLELRKFQVAEASRILRIPAHMLGDLENATFSNIEHLAIEFVQNTIRPWCVRWEQRIRNTFLSRKEYNRIYPEFVLDGLLRGDVASRFAAYATARQWGWMSANDIREKENMNPIEGGDTYLTPLNMVPTGTAPAPTARALLEALEAEYRRLEPPEPHKLLKGV